MAKRDIDINMNVTFWGNGVLLETVRKTLTKSEMADNLNVPSRPEIVRIKMISKRTIPETADKWNDKLDGFLSTFARNTNCRYSEEKENIESICPKKELYHVDLSKPIGIIIDGYLYGIEVDEKED